MSEGSNNGNSTKAESGVASPCNQTCRLSADNDLCEGCFRTVQEIIEWTMYTQDQKHDVIQRAAERRENK